MKSSKVFVIAITILTMMSAALAQQPATQKKSDKQPLVTPTPLVVDGIGTTGRITKWIAPSIISNSVIFEDKFGKIGIGTTAPTSTLTVQGMIETTLGGYKFPDGTVQSTAAVTGLQSIVHNDTLAGNGTSGSPLGIQVPLNLSSPGGTTLTIRNFGNSGFDIGVLSSSSGTGVEGLGDVYGVFGSSGLGIGVRGESNTGAGVLGRANFTAALAAKFEGTVKIISNGLTDPGFKNPGNLLVMGDVAISGNLSKASGSFKIDHPLDPENKYLYHSFVESPDMKNIYDGLAKLDANGEAVVELPDWFQALNGDYRYLLTAIGAPAPSLYIAEKVSNNRFKIAGGMPGLEVSWQVTGIRQDAYANKHRIQVEVEKTKEERGYYLHPTEFGQPAEKSLERAPISEPAKEAHEKARKQNLQ